MLDMVTLGESMVLMNPLTNGPLQYVYYFSKHVAGAESNVAIGVRRLGFKSGWISRVGNDEFGKYILSFIRGQGVDVSQVKVDAEAPTGVFFKERRGFGLERVYYYRQGSAASKLSPEDLDPDYIGRSRILHLTGITPALSDSCRAATLKAVEIARRAGVKVILDPNLRLKLWSAEEARQFLLPLLEQVDAVLPNQEEAKLLTGCDEIEEACRDLARRGCSLVVTKVGAKGALLYVNGEVELVPGYRVPRVVDTVGAGDAFAAGFIAGLLAGLDPVAAVRQGNLLGALAVGVEGDIEGLPESEDLNHLALPETVSR
jgi:2-dehydro-3-deoxygluconokinase